MGCKTSKHLGVDIPELKDNPEAEKKENDKRASTLRKELGDKYKLFLAKKDEIKPMVIMKAGIHAAVDEEQKRLLDLLERQENLAAEKAAILRRCWEVDCEELYACFGSYSVDKGTLIRILINRTKWQCDEISAVFYEKYGKSLISFVLNEIQTTLGKLTGSSTGVAKLISYRLMKSDERDAAFIKDYSDGTFGLDDENLLEMVLTRTNAELQAAMETYHREYQVSLSDVIERKGSQPNYRQLMSVILDCRRDESGKAFEDSIATKLANELYEAGAGRTIGFNPEPFIRILANVSREQFLSINAKYKGNQLLEDIKKKIGGDFQMALVARCSDKYEYLADRVKLALTKNWSADKDAICRIFGCLTRFECIKLRETYDKLNQYKPLEPLLRSKFPTGNFVKALVELCNPETNNTPLNSFKEKDNEDAELDRDGDRARELAEKQFRDSEIIEKGKIALKLKQKKRREKEKKSPLPPPPPINEDGEKHDEEDGSSSSFSSPPIPSPPLSPEDEISADDDDEVPKYSYDSVSNRFVNVVKLQRELKECTTAYNEICLLKERFLDDISATKDVYFSIVRHCSVAEGHIRVYTQQLAAVNSFMERRARELQAASAANPNNKNKASLLAGGGGGMSKKGSTK